MKKNVKAMAQKYFDTTDGQQVAQALDRCEAWVVMTNNSVNRLSMSTKDLVFAVATLAVSIKSTMPLVYQQALELAEAAHAEDKK